MLVVRMYEGAMRFLRVALEHHAAGRIGERGQSISRAMAIVNELQQILDLEAGGEIAANLDSLYIFVMDRLLDANLTGQMESLNEALGILTTLNEGWREIAKISPEVLATAAAAP